MASGRHIQRTKNGLHQQDGHLGANFYNAVEQIKTRLGKNAIVLQLPIGKEDDFKGIIDLMEMEAYIYNDDKGDDITVCEIPDDMKEDAELYHTELVEKICELDDELMMMYLEDEIPTVDQLKAVLRKATCECTAVPVAVDLLTETKVFRNFWMQSLNICRLRQTSRQSRVLTKMVMK